MIFLYSFIGVKIMAETEFRHIVRVVNTDLDGRKHIVIGLRKIKGIGFQFANMACSILGISKKKKTGDLTDEEIKKIEDFIKNPRSYNISPWMLNRRKDYEDNQDRHLLLTDLSFVQDNDIKRLKKIKCFKGVRHTLGQPVRGQRTKAHFRRNKGKVLGVKRGKMKSGKV